MKKNIKIMIMALLMISSVNVLNERVDATPVNIPDDEFRRCLNDKLEGLTGISRADDEVVTIAEMSTIPAIGCYGSAYDIESIEGAQYLVNSNHIDIRQNRISDISRLSNLTDIEYLDVSENNITDMSPVEDMIKLERISFHSNEVTGDVSFLSKLTELNAIWGYGNQISDVNTGMDWSLLTKLERVYFSYNNISDISSLSGLSAATNLNTLWLHHNTIADISSLSALDTTTIADLSLRNNYYITDVSPLTNLTTLRSLTLNNSEIVDITPLATLVNLTYLSIGGNNVGDITTINNLTNLNTLMIHGNNITDAAFSAVDWDTFHNLDTLLISYNHITDLTPLENIVGNLTDPLNYFQPWIFSNQTVTLPDKVVYTSTYKISDADLPVIKDADGSVIPYETSSNQPQTFTNGETKTLTATWEHDVEIAGGQTAPFSKTVEQKVTYIFPLSIDADDFTIHIDDAVDIYDLLSKTLANARAEDIINNLDLFDKITVNGIELDKIKKTDVTGVFDLTFTVDHNGESATKTIKVTVIGEKTPPPVTPEPVLPETGGNSYLTILLLSTVVMYMFKRKVIKNR